MQRRRRGLTALAKSRDFVFSFFDSSSEITSGDGLGRVPGARSVSLPLPRDSAPEAHGDRAGVRHWYGEVSCSVVAKWSGSDVAARALSTAAPFAPFCLPPSWLPNMFRVWYLSLSRRDRGPVPHQWVRDRHPCSQVLLVFVALRVALLHPSPPSFCCPFRKGGLRVLFCLSVTRTRLRSWAS